ncbi:MAG: ribosome biogenesis GTP-binding protein YihA/YsxC [Oscillospiraceae bacterium]|jgi:GTP-binding protein|nr:ribosome biogenesis GTP-binding protein YihA/YsxC [Oscillospiraceae bacterium]
MNINNVKFETSFGLAAQLPPSDLPEIAFCGRSNVGKSSMINKVFNRKSLARVSGVPGKTATVNFFLLENIRFIDLPGYGYAKVSKSEKARWGKLMDEFFSSGRALELVFLLLDIRHPPSADDQIMINFLRESGYPFSVILTKADKLSKERQRLRLEGFREEIENSQSLTMTPFSAKTGQGVDEIYAMMRAIAEEDR